MSGRRAIPNALWILAVIGLGIGSGCGSTVKPTVLATKPARIASLTLATDEILAELVPSERVVSVTYLADDPGISNVAGRYPKEIPRLRDIHVERLLALAPDLICVAPFNTADSLRLLEHSGRSTYRNEVANGLSEIEASVRRLGERLGEPERANRMVEQMQSRRRRIADRLHDVPTRPRVLFWSAGFTAGRKTTIDDIIREGGGLNVATDLGLEGSAEIAPERVVAADPDVILLSLWKGDERQAQVTSHPILRQLRAVREGRLVTIEGRYLTCISQFAVEGVERLARALHPDRFAEEAPQ